MLLTKPEYYHVACGNIHCDWLPDVIIVLIMDYAGCDYYNWLMASAMRAWIYRHQIRSPTFSMILRWWQNISLLSLLVTVPFLQWFLIAFLMYLLNLILWSYSLCWVKYRCTKFMQHIQMYRSEILLWYSYLPLRQWLNKSSADRYETWPYIFLHLSKHWMPLILVSVVCQYYSIVLFVSGVLYSVAIAVILNVKPKHCSFLAVYMMAWFLCVF